MERSDPAAGLPSPDESESELSQLAANLQNVAETEKVQLARQLHDELGGALVGAKMDLAWLRRKVGSTDPDVIARWDRLERALETGIAFKRRIVEQLRPTLLDNLGFYAAARWLVDETCAGTALKSDVQLPMPEPQLSKEVAIALFRVLQESLVNVVRHARAKMITVSVSVDPAGKLVRLTIADDGVGLTPDRLRTLGSRGLGSMRHRLRSVGGQFKIQSARGTQVVATAPMA